MRKKTIAKRAPREKIYKQPTKPSTRSQDRTFTPSPSPPTSPPHCDLMARTKNTPRFPASAKPTPPPKATPSKPASSKPGSSKPSSSKGKRQATEEPVPEPQQPRARPTKSQAAKWYENDIARLMGKAQTKAKDRSQRNQMGQTGYMNQTDPSPI
nr:extensin-like [Arachis hypogaea]